MRLRTALLGVAASAVILTACSSSADDEGSGGHGHVEGAVEESEAQYRLTVADGEGEATTIDLLSEETTSVEVDGDRLETDGRFVYSRGDDSVDILDSGVWTWPHGDHNHYYSSDAADVDSIDLGAGHLIGGFGHDTVHFDDESGEVTVIDRDKLEDHEVDSTTFSAAEPHHGFALDYDGSILASTSSGDELPDGLALYDNEGNEEGTIDVPCAEMHGTARVGDRVVIACDQGVLIVEGEEAELVPYPEGTERAWSLEQRPHATDLAALQGEEGDGLLLLNVNDRQLTAVDAPASVATVALGTDLGVLALGADGTLRHYDQDGRLVAEQELLSDVDPDNPPTLVADASRAYVNDADEGVIHEIDYNDDLREARTLETDGVTPTHLVETGW